MKIVNKFCIVLTVAATLMSCTKEPAEAERHTKIYTLSCKGDAGTKAQMLPGNTIQWRNGDYINYWTYGSGTTSQHNEGVTDNADETILKVTYLDGDTDVVGVFCGDQTTMGTPSDITGTSFTLVKGINAEQDGVFETHAVCVATAELKSEDNLEFKAVQSFISFDFLGNLGGDGQYSKIEVKGKFKDASTFGDIAADKVTYTFNSAAAYTLGDTKYQSITIDTYPEFVELNKTYYVAIMPGEYDQLVINLYDHGVPTPVACVETGNVTIAKGEIKALGTLDSRWYIPARSLTTYPKTAYITNRATAAVPGGYRMSKKIYCDFSPSDVTAGTWVVTPSTAGTVEDLGKETVTTTSGTKEYLVGRYTPALGYTGTCNVGVTFKGGFSGSCTVTVGDFVDLGLTDASGNAVLWAFSNLDSGGLCGNYDDFGGYYIWGETTPRASGDECPTYDWNVWDDMGFTSGTGIIDNAHDAAYQASPKGKSTGTDEWHMPSKEDASLLETNTEQLNAMSPNDVYGWKFISTVFGYQDMELFIPAAGWKGYNGIWYMKRSYATILLNKVKTSDDEWYIGNSGSPANANYTVPVLMSNCWLYCSGYISSRSAIWSIRPVMRIPRT